jgi:hypothetical protein
MQFNPITIAGTLVGGLILAGLLGWIRKPRLVVLVPRSFSYSQLTDRGQLVEISVFNRGFKTEDSVELILNHALKYELLGANYQDATLDENKLKIPRIGPTDEVTVLLMVENGSFKQGDIVQCLSKENKGSVVSKLEEVPPSGPQRIAIIGMFIVVPSILYGLTFGIDYIFKEINKTDETIATKASNKNEPIDVRGWKVPWYNKSTSTLLPKLESGEISVDYGEITRRQDIASIPIIVSNKTNEVIKARISMATSKSAKRFKSYELLTDEMLITPGKKEMQTIRVVIPTNTTDEADRIVFVDATIQNTDGQILTFTGQKEVR